MNEVRTGYAANQAYSDSFVESDRKAIIAEYNRQIDVIQMAISKIRRNIPKSLPKYKQVVKIQPKAVEKIVWPIAKVGNSFLYLTEDWKFVFYAIVMVTVGDDEKERVKQFFELNLNTVKNSFSEVTNGHRPVTEKFMLDAAQGAVDFFCSPDIERVFNIKPDEGWVAYIETRPSFMAAKQEKMSLNKANRISSAKSTAKDTAWLLLIGSAILAAICLVFYLSF